jgi:glutathione peroxidase
MKSGKKAAAVNVDKIQPLVDFYSYTLVLNDSSQLPLSSLKEKKIVLVNTASDCGFTAQYEALQKLYDQYNSNIVVIGFPANDFQHQEKGTDAAIASFCKKNYGVTFPLSIKGVVVKKEQQEEIYQWLTHKSLNGWNDQAPTWNFCKYIVNEEGVLTHFFESGVPPLGKEMKAALGLD